jgi:hypothetical protein
MFYVYKDKGPLYPEIKTSNDNGEEKSALPTSPELTLVILDKAFGPLFMTFLNKRCQHEFTFFCLSLPRYRILTG